MVGKITEEGIRGNVVEKFMDGESVEDIGYALIAYEEVEDIIRKHIMDLRKDLRHLQLDKLGITEQDVADSMPELPRE